MKLKDLMSVMASMVDVTIYDSSGFSPLYECDGELPDWLEDTEVLAVYIEDSVSVCVKAFDLDDYFKWHWWDDQNIVVDRKVYPVEMTLDPNVPDNRCNRVLIDGDYYYFS